MSKKLQHNRPARCAGQWWRHQMETFSALLAICAGSTVASDAELWCILCRNKRLSKQSWGWWFETPSRPLWHHCNGNSIKRWLASRAFRGPSKVLATRQHVWLHSMQYVALLHWMVGLIWLIEAEWRMYASINKPSFVQIMACRLVGAKPLSEPTLEYCQLEP